MNKILTASILSIILLSQSVFGLTQWKDDYDAQNGLYSVDISQYLSTGLHLSSDTFDFEGDKYTILSLWGGNHIGFKRNENLWVPDDSITKGLDDYKGYDMKTPVTRNFNLEGEEYMMTGDYNGYVFLHKWDYDGGKWNSIGRLQWRYKNDDIIQTHLNGWGAAPTFTKFNGDVYMIMGRHQDGLKNDFISSELEKGDLLGTGDYPPHIVVEKKFTEGLPYREYDMIVTATPTDPTPDIFEYEDEKYMLISWADGLISSYRWNGNEWEEDVLMSTGIVPVGAHTKINVYETEGDIHSLVTNREGLIIGYELNSGIYPSGI